MKFRLRLLFISLLLLGWLSASSSAQEVSTPAAQPLPQPAVSNGTDYARTLRDPFSPIGYRLPEEARAMPTAGVPVPSGDLITRAKSHFKLLGVVQRTSNYVANVNGTIVQVGDELSTTVDGVTVTFIIRAIGLDRIEVEPQK